MPCNLIIIGKNLDLDSFLNKSKLRGYMKVYKGEPKFKSRPQGPKLPYSQLGIQTSKAAFSDLEKQIKDTIRYLERNKEKLASISITKEVDYALLDFGTNLKINNKKTFAQFEAFPKMLVELAGELGLSIQLSIYPAD